MRKYYTLGCLFLLMFSHLNAHVKELLSLDVIEFKAQRNGDVIEVNWETESESNSDYFTIEKTTDGVNYVEVAQVNAAGFSNSSRSYQITDLHPLDGMSYYRLKQTDLNGRFFYSGLAEIEYVSRRTELVVYPNPGNGAQISLQISSEVSNEEVLVSVEDVQGKIRASQIVNVDSESDDLIHFVFPDKLPAGMYIVSIRYSKYFYSKKVIVE